MTGAGSQSNNNGTLYVGRTGTGELTIADGGMVNVTNDTFLGQYAGTGNGVIHFHL